MSKITKEKHTKMQLNNLALVAAIVEWLYLNDRAFDSVHEWRAELIMHLKGLVTSRYKKIPCCGHSCCCNKNT